MSPALERLAIEYLASPSVPIARGAAALLGKYGSVAAREPLWKAMEAPAARENARLEDALATALGSADAWVLEEASLQRLQKLCSAAGCRQHAAQWLKGAQEPIRIDILPGIDAPMVMMAGRDAVPMERLRRKLSQYPPGTRFQLIAGAEFDRAPVEKTVRETGHVLVP
jgi:hypothetical protein